MMLFAHDCEDEAKRRKNREALVGLGQKQWMLLCHFSWKKMTRCLSQTSAGSDVLKLHLQILCKRGRWVLKFRLLSYSITVFTIFKAAFQTVSCFFSSCTIYNSQTTFLFIQTHSEIKNTRRYMNVYRPFDFDGSCLLLVSAHTNPLEMQLRWGQSSISETFILMGYYFATWTSGMKMDFTSSPRLTACGSHLKRTSLLRAARSPPSDRVFVYFLHCHFQSATANTSRTLPSLLSPHRLYKFN